MLVKVGTHRINLAHVVEAEDKDGASIAVYFVNGNAVEFEGVEASEFRATWDKWAQFQADAQTINEFAVAENLKQIRQAQNKSGIIQPVPKMPLVNRGRG